MSEAEGASGFDQLEQGVSLYVHVPFCSTKCSYCDFLSEPGASAGRRQRFVDTVIACLADETGPQPLLTDAPTLYVGGGTPSVLGTELLRLVKRCQRLVGLRDDAEITVELNPESTTRDLVGALMDVGVNRFSLGVQSFDDEVLRTLGRCHDAQAARAAAGLLHDEGITFSVDLMCGVPRQSLGSWTRTVLSALETGAPHVSVYPLSVEEGTPLAVRIADGVVAEPRPDDAADHMLAAEELLSAAGLSRYEIANYARPGAESRHNLGYWTGRPYVGIGPGAASMLDIHETRRRAPVWSARVFGPEATSGRARFVGSASEAGFVAESWGTARESLEVLDEAESKREDAMLGMRLAVGVPASDVEDAGLRHEFGHLETLGLVEPAGDAEDRRWRLTQRGWLLGNEVFRRIWTGA